MCTRILWNDNSLGVFVGRTMDWPDSTQPRLYVLPRGLRRDGGALGAQRVVSEAESFRWTSKYGSVVSSAYDMGAADGMNERGLGVHMLYFTSCDFGARTGKRPAVNAALWLQLWLDLAADVQEALALLDSVEIVSVKALGVESPVHVAVEDARGDSAIIEFVAGERKVYHGRKYVVMTNDPPYDEHLAFLGKQDFTNATRETALPGNVSSRDRFVRAAYYCKALPEPTDARQAVAFVMAIARNVSVPFGAPYKEPGSVYNTEYRTVLDLENRRYFFELTTNPSLIWLELGRFDLSPEAPVMSLDPRDAHLAGDVSERFSVVPKSPF